MANNRLYLVDTETKRAFMLAKTLGDGWYVFYDDLTQRLNTWFLDCLDFTAQYGHCDERDHSNLVIMTEHELPDDVVCYKSKMEVQK